MHLGICISLPLSFSQTPRLSSTFFFPPLLRNMVPFVTSVSIYLLNLKPLSLSPPSPLSLLLVLTYFCLLGVSISFPFYFSWAAASSLRVKSVGMGCREWDVAREGKDDIAAICVDTAQFRICWNPGPLKSSQIGLRITGSYSIPRVFLPRFYFLKREESKSWPFPSCLGLESFLSSCRHFIPSQGPDGHSPKGPHPLWNHVGPHLS